MAHLTKYYPCDIRRDWAYLYAPGYFAPRKWFIHNTGTAHGTYALPWQGIDVLSELPTYGSGDGQIQWKCNHPSVSDNYILMKWDFHLVTPATAFQNDHKTTITAEFWKDGIKYGSGTVHADGGEMFLGNPPLAGQFNVWPSHPSPSLFQDIGTTFFRAARWQDDPDFHPYRFVP